MRSIIYLALVLALTSCTKTLDPQAVGNKHREDISTHPANKPVTITPTSEPKTAASTPQSVAVVPTSTAASMPIQQAQVVTMDVEESIYEPTSTLVAQMSHPFNDINYQYEGDWTRLMYETAKENMGAVEYLVKNGANICIRNNKNLNVFDIAAALGKNEILNLLLSVESKIHSDDNFPHPIHHAIINANNTDTLNNTLKLLKYPQSYWPRVGVCFDASSSTLGAQGASKHFQYVPEDFIDNQASANIENLKDEEKVTALMFASASGNLEIVERLIDGGVNVNSVNKTGVTALMIASARGYARVVEYLIKHGAQVDKADKRGMTALVYAYQTQQYSVYQLIKCATQ